MFQAIVKANGKTSEEYIINTFNYTLRETTLELHVKNFLIVLFKS
jgi:hypothetical protein